MARRHYSDRDRAAALAIFDALDDQPGRVSRAARESKVPRRTLGLWIEERDRAAPAEVRQEERKALRDLYEEHIRIAMGVAARKVDEAVYREVMIGVGILDDKLTRADGLPTSRVEVDDKRDPEQVAGRVAEILDMAKYRKAKTG